MRICLPGVTGILCTMSNCRLLAICGCKLSQSQANLLKCRTFSTSVLFSRSKLARLQRDNRSSVVSHGGANSISLSYFRRDSMLVPARGHIRNLSQDSNINKKGEWSFAKKLALLWGGAVAAIGLILYLDFNTHGKYVDAEEIKRKQQRMQGEEGGVMRYIISMPCMRTTLMLMMVGGLTSWVVTFLLTSNPRRAFIMLCNSPVVLGSLFFAFCSYETAGDQADVAEFQSALDGIRKKHTLHEDKPPQSSDDTEK